MNNKKLIIEFLKSKLNQTFRSYELQQLALRNYTTAETTQRVFRKLKANQIALNKEGITVKEISKDRTQCIWKVELIDEQQLELI